jgi:DNA invertase Pin-like site-specific DNA recombinase
MYIFAPSKPLNVANMKTNSTKCVIFSRVSTSSQSLDSQNAILYQYAYKEGYNDSEIQLIEQTESAVLNDIDNRIGIQQLFKLVEETPSIKCVIVFEISRIARRPDVLYKVRDYLLEKKIQLICIKPEIRLLDEEGNFSQSANLIFSIFSSLAESEGFIRKERFARAKNMLKQQGKKFAGAVKFGYIKNEDKYCEPHPLISKIIVRLFNYYNDNDTSLYETYKYASSEWSDIFPMTEYIKAQHKIRNILNDKVYAYGNWCYEPFVDKDIFESVKDKLSKAQSKARYGSKLNLLGRGKVVCGHCNHVMVGAGGNVQAYYCATDKTHSLQINIAAMDWLIWHHVMSLSNSMSYVNNKTRIAEISHEIENKRTLLEQYKLNEDSCDKKIEKLLDLYLDGKIQQGLYDKRLSVINDEKSDWHNKTTNIMTQINQLEDMMQNGHKPEHVDFSSIEDFDLKLELVRKYIDKIVLTKENDYTILSFHYNMPVIGVDCKYKYISKGGRKKIYRINEDNTEDRIF